MFNLAWEVRVVSEGALPHHILSVCCVANLPHNLDTLSRDRTLDFDCKCD
jgi:hypothetical protein